MKRLILSAILIFLYAEIIAQPQIPGIEKIWKSVEMVLDGETYEVITLDKTTRIQNRKTFYRLDDCGKRKDGKPLGEYEADDIIHFQEGYNRVLFDALCKAFTKEERVENDDQYIIITVVLGPDGNILETAYVYPYVKKTIRPEQIAVFDRELLKNLKYRIDPEKAAPYLYLMDQFKIHFAYFRNFVESPDPTPNPSQGNPLIGTTIGNYTGSGVLAK